jgi:hypothetical protein
LVQKRAQVGNLRHKGLQVLDLLRGAGFPTGPESVFTEADVNSGFPGTRQPGLIKLVVEMAFHNHEEV